MTARQRAHARAPVRERAPNLIGRAGRALEYHGFRRHRPDGFRRQDEHSLPPMECQPVDSTRVTRPLVSTPFR
jgi:hypothetical protein